jgi:hypothetical protein
MDLNLQLVERKAMVYDLMREQQRTSGLLARLQKEIAEIEELKEAQDAANAKKPGPVEVLPGGKET